VLITISGNPGSGKSTVAKILQKELSLERVYAGSIMREMAREKGLTLMQLGELCKDDPAIDKEIDRKTAEEAHEFIAQGKGVIVEGRVQFHFLPESIKIFIKVDPQEGAKRIFKDLQHQELAAARNEKVPDTLEEMQELVASRDAQDAARYIKFYGIDHRDTSQFDFVVDSTVPTAKEVAEIVLDYLDERS